jgi:acetyltransferase-like isoleucine patch superfamily enzyme
MQIGIGFTTGQYCRIEAGRTSSGKKSLTIGRFVQINDRCHIAALNSIEIGDNVLIASNVFITDHDHGDTSPESLQVTPAQRPLSHSPVKIEKNVWIGQNAVILKGVTIGESSVIAAGSVVTRNVPPFCVVAGIPATILKQVPKP